MINGLPMQSSTTAEADLYYVLLVLKYSPLPSSPFFSVALQSHRTSKHFTQWTKYFTPWSFLPHSNYVDPADWRLCKWWKTRSIFLSCLHRGHREFLSTNIVYQDSSNIKIMKLKVTIAAILMHHIVFQIIGETVRTRVLAYHSYLFDYKWVQ